MKKRNQKGFSLIELLIVVAIILIIAAIAIPNLMKSKQTASESSAVSVLRTISSAQVMYSIAHPGADYATIVQLQGDGLIDNSISSTVAKNNYTFEIPTNTAAGWVAKAVPKDTNNGYYYCVDQTNVIRKGTAVNTDTGATCPDTLQAVGGPPAAAAPAGGM